MNKRILLAISVLLVLGLAIAAFAYNQNSGPTAAKAACCCCSGDSCPMKSGSDGQMSDDCCCKNGGNSCPMKKHSEHAGVQADSADNAAAGCDCPCCKDKANV